MKKRLLTVIFVLAFAISLNGCISAVKGMVDNAAAVKGMMGGGEKGEKVDIEDLSKNGNKLVAKVKAAVIQSYTSKIKIAEAAGDKLAVQELQTELEEVKSSSIEDTAGFKDVLKEKVGKKVQSEMKSWLAKIDVNDANAKKHLTQGALHLGAAIILDAQAAQQLPDIIERYKNAVQSLSRDITRINDLKKLKGGLSLFVFLGNAVPNQLKNMQESFTSLAEYMTDHNIEMPSDQEREEMAQGSEGEFGSP